MSANGQTQPTAQITIGGKVYEARSPSDNLAALKDGNYRLRCLLYGRAGTGKSRMACTFPGTKGIIDTDSGALVYTDKWGPCKIWSIGEDSTLSAGKPTAWEAARQILDIMISDPDIDCIVLDSFTTLADACIKKIMSDAGRDSQAPSFVEWSRQMELLKEFLFKAFSSGKHVISIFHEDVEKDELTGQIWCLPLITGKLARKIPGYHDEVYHMEPTVQGNTKVYQVLTRATRMYVAKSRLDSLIGLPEKIDADFSVIMKKIQAVQSPSTR